MTSQMTAEQLRAQTYLAHIELKPRVHENKAIAKALKEAGVAQPFVLTELPSPKHVAREPIQFRRTITTPYISIRIPLYDELGVKNERNEALIRQAKTLGKLVLDPNQASTLEAERCPIATAHGFTKTTLFVNSIKLHDSNRGITAYCSLEPLNFDKLTGRYAEKGLKFSRRMKRHKRALSKAMLTITGRQVAATDTTHPILLEGRRFEVKASIPRIAITGLYRYGIEQDLRGIQYEFTYKNVDRNDPANQDICNYFEGLIEGGSKLGMHQYNAILDTFGIDVRRAHPGSAVKFTKEDHTGHDKGVAEATWLQHHLMLFFGTKKEVGTEGEVIFHFDVYRPGEKLNVDYETFINCNLGDCKFRDTGLSLMEGAGQEMVDDFKSMILDADHGIERLAQILPNLVKETESDEEGNIAPSKWFLPSAVRSLAAREYIDLDGKRYGVQHEQRLMKALIRYLKTVFTNKKQLRFPLPADQGATGYLCADRKLTYHSDPVLNGDCYNLDNRGLAAEEIAMTWPNADGLRVALESDCAFLYRRPFSSVIEGIPQLKAVRKMGYDLPESCFVYLSIQPVEITPAWEQHLEMLLTRQRREDLMKKAIVLDGVRYISTIAIYYALMGGGDGDDLGCVLLNGAGVHATQHYAQLFTTYPTGADIALTVKTAAKPNRHADIGRFQLDYQLRKEEENALLKMLEDNTIGKMTIGEFIVNAYINHYGLDVVQAKAPALIDFCSVIRSKENVIDEAKMGKGEIDTDKANALLQGVYRAVVESDLKLPRYLFNRLSEYRQNSIPNGKVFTSGVDQAWDNYLLDQEQFFASLEDRFVYPATAETCYLLEYYPTRPEIWAQAKALRTEFTERVSARKDELVRERNLTYKGHKTLLEKVEAQASVVASGEVDAELYQGIDPLTLAEIAIATYQIAHKKAYTQQLKDENGNVLKVYQTYNDGQVFLPVLGEALLRGLDLASGTEPAPLRPSEDPALTPEQDSTASQETQHSAGSSLKLVLVNGASNHPEKIAPLQAAADVQAQVSVLYLSAADPQAVEFLQSEIPSWKEQNICEDAAVVYRDGELYAWVSRRSLPALYQQVEATGQAQFTGIVVPQFNSRKERVQTSVYCLIAC